jgi:type I restriction enzyme S subunit
VTLRSNVDQKIKGVIHEAGWQRIHTGDFAISGMNAHLGGMGVSDSLGKCSPIYLVLEPLSDTNAHFVSYSVRHIAQIGVLKSLVNTIRFNSADFKRADLKSIRVWLPPTDEQTHIVRFLAHADRNFRKLIRAKRRVIELLNEQKQAIIHDAVTRGVDPNVRLKPSGIEWLGDVPEHWQVQKVKRISRIVRGRFSYRPRNDPSLYDGKYPFIQTGEVARAGKKITSYSQTLNEKGLAVSKMFSAGTLVMTIAANIGDVAVLSFDACFPDSVVGFEPKPSLIDRDYLYYVFCAMKAELLKEAPVNTQGNLNVERVGSKSIGLPSLQEQLAIVQRIEIETAAIEMSIESTKSEIALLREYRTRLIADVVTGKLDVRGVKLPELEAEEALESLSETEDEELDDSEELVAAGGDADAD